MRPEQIEAIQTSFAKVVPISQAAVSLFYGRLFILAPEVGPPFKNDMSEQGRKLMTTLAAVVNGLKNLDDVVPVNG